MNEIQQRADQAFPNPVLDATPERVEKIRLQKAAYIKGAEEWYNKGKEEVNSLKQQLRESRETSRRVKELELKKDGVYYQSKVQDPVTYAHTMVKSEMDKFKEPKHDREMKDFAEWIDDNKWMRLKEYGDHRWFSNSTLEKPEYRNGYTTSELLELYRKTIK